MLVIAFLGPVMAAVGVMLTIPLTTLADYVLVGTRVGWNTIFGSCFILAGYSLLLYSDMVIIPAADDTNEEGEGRAGEVVAAAACVEEQDEEEGDIIKNLLPSNERTPLLPHH